MEPHAHPNVRAVQTPALEVADLVRTFGPDFVRANILSSEQHAVLRDIERCRTAALGGHVDVCNGCGLKRIAYNSCRNRHCPKCQSLAGARWVKKRMERILPTHFFHVVFTLPKQLRPLAIMNPEVIYNLLFAAASESLLELGDNPKWLGARVGVTSVLHTWTRELLYHPHVHCVVTGGGLSPDGLRWVDAPQDFLFPVRVLGELFRGKFIDGMRQARKRGLLKFEGNAQRLGDPAVFDQLCNKLSQVRWVVYCKQPFGGPENVFSYLGRYTHRTGISNSRLISSDGERVTFRTRGEDTVTVTGLEFLRRFLQHVLPKGYIKIRHHGLMAPGNVKTLLSTARRLLEARTPPVPTVPAPTPGPADFRDLLKELTGVDLRRCPACGGEMVRHALPRERGPPIAGDTS